MNEYYGCKEKETKNERSELSHANSLSRKILKLKRIRKNSFKMKKKRRMRSQYACDRTVKELNLQIGQNTVSPCEGAEELGGSNFSRNTRTPAQEVSNSASSPSQGSVFNNSSLLDEILSEKKMALLASVEMVEFLREHMLLSKSY